MGEFQPEGIQGGLLSKARLDLYCGSTSVLNIDLFLARSFESIILGLSLGPAQINSQKAPLQHWKVRQWIVFLAPFGLFVCCCDLPQDLKPSKNWLQHSTATSRWGRSGALQPHEALVLAFQTSPGMTG